MASLRKCLLLFLCHTHYYIQLPYTRWPSILVAIAHPHLAMTFSLVTPLLSARVLCRRCATLLATGPISHSSVTAPLVDPLDPSSVLTRRDDNLDSRLDFSTAGLTLTRVDAISRSAVDTQRVVVGREWMPYHEVPQGLHVLKPTVCLFPHQTSS